MLAKINLGKTSPPQQFDELIVAKVLSHTICHGALRICHSINYCEHTLYTAFALAELAQVYHRQGNAAEALALFKRALVIAENEKPTATDHQDTDPDQSHQRKRLQQAQVPQTIACKHHKASSE